LSKNVDQLNTSQRNVSLNGSMSGGGGNNDLVTPSIAAYKSDNAKLIKENNELHMELIKIRDEFELNTKELKSKLSRVEHENSDLRFLNTQYLHKLRAIEKESKDKTKKILELQEKNFQAVIQTPSKIKKFN
jgi:centrosomal protein CEP135